MNFNLKAITDRLAGKTTAFLMAFFVSGHVMSYFHRLDATYITFMTALLGYVVGHSYKEDKHEQAMAGIQNGGQQ